VRESRYARMATLRAHRDRASELAQPDDDAIRRSGPPARRPSGEAAGDQAGAPGVPDSRDDGEDGFESEPDLPDPVDDGAGFVASSVVLADVVDRTTADALRRAGRSSDPRGRAEAAGRARREVEQRLERLERSRRIIERHLRKLDR